MKIINATTGAPVATFASEASNPWTRFRGLMLRGRLQPGEGLLIRPCGSIHMMFMRFSIDAVFYDKDMNVTKVVHSLPPWIGLAFGGKGAKGVIELPAGAAEGIEAGHQLALAA
ncbi:hypothetical protein AYO38_10650 [bacterium SCGC AG-212-C10]|nr:hypothetical protein AYO38_10650 [bacterium SCGC AG-212-C10]